MSRGPLPLRGIAYVGERIRVGKFRAHPTDELFTNSGPTRACLLVFPRTAVRIRHAGKPSVVADPTRVMFYNAGQEYTRAAISPIGDSCDWLAFDEADVAEAIARFDPSAADRPLAPFARTHGPSDPHTYALQRLVHENASSGAPDALFVEEAALSVLARVVRNAHAHAVETRPATPSRARHARLANAARERLALEFTGRVSVVQLARALEVSVFHLCRVFRRETGHSIHAYVTALRLHHALERLSDGADLTTLGLELGFASHSHFSTSFRRMFGLPPSKASKILKARSLRDVTRSRPCGGSFSRS
jgi:AraC-like DNA-binding protein